MTIRTKVTHNGIEIKDYRNLNVKKSMSNFNSSSTFTALVDTPHGRHSSDFTVGEEIQVFADKDDTPTTNIFTGVLEKIKFRGEGTIQTLELSGRDFSLRLQDSTVQPIVFTDSEISTIVTNIIQDNVQDITINNVNVTETTLPRISFNQESVFEALTQLAELSGYFFYVDEDKDLHFEQRNTTSSGITLDNTNILKNTFNQTREGMANKIWVYGDRYLAGFKEINLLNGSAWGGEPGSVFTLLSKPHNTFIEYLGNPLNGAIFEMLTTPTSGPDYLVNYNDKQLIFQSGTEIGYSSIPISGGSIISIYDRELPIVKYGQNKDSINAFGPKSKIINDKTIKDPQTAVNILKSELEKSNPFKGLEIEVNGWMSFTPGNTIQVVLEDFNLNDVVSILEVNYNFNKNTIQSENIIKVSLNTKIKDLTDEITNLRRRLDLIEGADRQDTDVITRLETSTGSFAVVGSYWAIQTREVTGSVMIWDNPLYDEWDSDLWGNENGSPYTPYSIITSGGFY